MNKLHLRAIRSSIFGTLTMAALLFIPAGTLNYWEGWAFMATFIVSTTVITVYLAMYDPKLLERRMNAGVRAEKERSQKVIVTLMLIGFLSFLVYPVLDHRFGWSPVPAYVSILGDALITLGFLLILFVLRENSYSASTIQIAKDQRVVSTGPYAIVRHPMYAAAIPLVAGIPLALGSWWGLFILIPFFGVLVWRLLDEERFLHKRLPGYTEYTERVRYRLVPHVW